ncbi:MAG: hypothetical protein LCH58_05270 [Bacteroidetes bacterium]|uniref:hypothetical protein n=1 Tax=Phnomibacter sp. TaxID=2836217 RepID=UPI002FDDDB52|nr:hypothetical protein [Bacteroidota bacterium]
MKKPILNVEYLIQFVSSNSLPNSQQLLPDDIQLSNQEKSKIYQELLDNLAFSDYSQRAIEELKAILRVNKSLEQSSVKKWIKKHIDFFDENLCLFGIDYLDPENHDYENIRLPALNEYVDKTPFLPIIHFWECMLLLYSKHYHLDLEARPVDEVNSYYFTAPYPGESKDIEKILNYISLT